jgi:heptosyltransferase II
MRVLIVKHGGLGDVVRTSYFLSPLRARLGIDVNVTWVTARSALPLLQFNPHIDRLVSEFCDLYQESFDIVYSLDDELDVLEGVAKVRARRVVGAYINCEGVTYSADSAPWFDMGLRSTFGKARADQLKLLNDRGQGQIFSEIFEVSAPMPEFFGDPLLEAEYAERLDGIRPIVGINPFAGGRWPAKELPRNELRSLVQSLLERPSSYDGGRSVGLIGAGSDRARNLELADEIRSERIHVFDTDRSVLALAALIRNLDLLITSDSLAMHLAVSQRIPTIAFFAPTSAAEIDSFGLVMKIASTSPDYCSYRPMADNSTITAERIIQAVRTFGLSVAAGIVPPFAFQTLNRECKS